MKLHNYDQVQLLVNNYVGQGVDIGAIGYIIEVYPDMYEVEFSNAHGITIAQLVLSENEVDLVE